MDIRIKRIYQDPSPDDGYRLLVDRLWPRGISKDKAKLDEWMKEVGPSSGLRKWFGHEPAKYPEFKKRYEKELKEKSELLEHIREVGKKQRVSLLYGAKDQKHNQAVVLREVLLG